jgi:hypothetical protein
MILKFRNGKESQPVGLAHRQAGSKSIAIHGQRFHQQAEVAAMVIKCFMRIIGTHAIQK